MGVSIKTTVASTVPLIACRYLIKSEHQIDGEVISGQGAIDSVNCQIEEMLNAEKFSDGNYLLKIEAEDTAGLRLNNVARSFQVSKEAPDINLFILGTMIFYLRITSIFLDP